MSPNYAESAEEADSQEALELDDNQYRNYRKMFWNCGFIVGKPF